MFRIFEIIETFQSDEKTNVLINKVILINEMTIHEYNY